jgi:hypothetical protein
MAGAAAVVPALASLLVVGALEGTLVTEALGEKLALVPLAQGGRVVAVGVAPLIEPLLGVEGFAFMD